MVGVASPAPGPSVSRPPRAPTIRPDERGADRDRTRAPEARRRPADLDRGEAGDAGRGPAPPVTLTPHLAAGRRDRRRRRVPGPARRRPAGAGPRAPGPRPTRGGVAAPGGVGAPPPGHRSAAAAGFARAGSPARPAAPAARHGREPDAGGGAGAGLRSAGD